MLRGLSVAGFLLIAASGSGTSVRQADAIVGRWRGTSTCIKAEWNSACNDERVVYFFERDAGSDTSVTVHAYKYVGTSLESMGDLACTYDPATKSWGAPFSNARVRIKWSFQPLPGGMLAGRLMNLANAQLARTVSARRDSIQTAPPPARDR